MNEYSDQRLTTHDAKCKTEQSHISEVEGRLEESIHPVQTTSTD